jgi:hypothetical protein
MADTKYNGWTNYETWLANLWLTNDQGGSEWLEDSARECVEKAIEDDKGDIRDEATDALASVLESHFDEMAEEWMPKQAGFFADLINAGLREVNWHEMARHAVDDVEIYSAGWNMPGYMPDNPPSVFLDASDALEYVKDAIQEEQTDIPTEDIGALKADSKGEFGVTVGKYHYFVARL